MSLYEIDRAATQARLDAITANGLRKLGECARRSEEIDKQVEDMRARQEREKRAMDERVKQAKEAKRAPEPPARVTPKPARLVLGGEEFREVRDRRPPEPSPAPLVPPGMRSRQARLAGRQARLAGAPGRPAPQAEQGRSPQPSPPGHPAAQPSPDRPQATDRSTRPADPPDGPPPRRTLMLGAPEDRAQDQPSPDSAWAPGGERPRSGHRPPGEADDDLSGRTWLR